ncbi:hypothetical protein SDC9_195150 [bioreactor metagenome]|uniref:Uncharacterized protein n=1 Tax=bioreactor metagenome TaxID=1076179 RepID=A0A645I868_9ZZZZ
MPLLPEHGGYEIEEHDEEEQDDESRQKTGNGPAPHADCSPGGGGIGGSFVLFYREHDDNDPNEDGRRTPSQCCPCRCRERQAVAPLPG